MTTNNKKLITHNGSFHSDDIFAAATLSLFLEKKGESFEIIRTRDMKVIGVGDYIFDVGEIYDPKIDRFDHHQIGGAGKRQNGIEYASFGLVWKKYGIEICNSERVVDMIDKKLAAPIDAGDNGFNLIENKTDIFPYFIQQAFSSMVPTWKEENINKDEIFLKCVEMAKNILNREIIQAQDAVLAEETVIAIYQNSIDKRIIMLDKDYPYENTINNFPEPLFVIYPRRSDGAWGIKAVRDNPVYFTNRKNFPKLWAGLQAEELANVSGVPDALFCHRALFMAVAKTKEGAMKLAQIAVNA